MLTRSLLVDIGWPVFRILTLSNYLCLVSHSSKLFFYQGKTIVSIGLTKLLLWPNCQLDQRSLLADSVSTTVCFLDYVENILTFLHFFSFNFWFSVNELLVSCLTVSMNQFEPDLLLFFFLLYILYILCDLIIVCCLEILWDLVIQIYHFRYQVVRKNYIDLVRVHRLI